ncbi:hypothetical protein PHLCEN_2v12875 [Hermanssonia centrifuga]|uniref:Uncharacterized protein n=1 Tax=Hermanssonia centrifuga TaxID=98765 RepID=A0A2R6NFX2_9APHY|nr:hypothetical protein PHLCEN_2v12875 [Hermanssonia centrifuga]
MDPNEPRKTAGMKRVQQYQQAFPSIDSESPGADTPLSGNGLPNLPTHSGELGRLPLHRIFGDSSSLSDLGNYLWSPSGSGLHPSVTSDATPGLDHSLESIFSDAIPPEVYDQLLGTLQGIESSHVQQLLNSGPQAYTQAPLTSNVALNYATVQTPVDNAGEAFSHFPDIDTLDIWSNAPTNFE